MAAGFVSGYRGETLELNDGPFPRSGFDLKMFLLTGLSHKTAPIEWRERFAVSEERLPAFLNRLREEPAVQEAVALSTCNRVEVYTVVNEAVAARRAVAQALGAENACDDTATCFYSESDEAAVRHLFRVASGLESLVVGEAEILGQVKRAYESARTVGFTGKLTNVVFQRALYVGKMVRSQTGISEGPTSTASLAVALSQKIFGDLKESRVLVLGAGKMAELSARYLLSQKVARLTVLNRTFEKARELAIALGGNAASFERLPDELLTADIVLCSTGSSEPVVKPDVVSAVMSRRRGRSLFFIDIAVPRDVDPAVHKIENVYLYNIDDLQAIVAESLNRRQTQLHQAAQLVDEKAREFSGWYAAWRSGASAPLSHAVPSKPAFAVSRDVSPAD